MRRNPIAAGSAVALLSAVAFGVTTPLVQRFGRGVGPFTTAALLYAGAAVVSLPLRGRAREGRLRKGDLARVALVAALGAVVAPVALAWGLQRTSGVGASLLLNLEAVLTVVLARLVWREPIGARVGAAVAAMVAGGAIIVAHGSALTVEGGLGAAAVALATLAWAADNVLGRPLADRDATAVVLAKGSLGAAASVVIAACAREPWPDLGAALALLACGAVGYGVSLRLYLGAQRLVGAARTGSVFAAAPFMGAIVAWTMGQAAGGVWTAAAGVLCAVGVVLHLTEAHEHPHEHAADEHDHTHRHDDGHHDHAHEPPVLGEHSHPHRHDHVRHAHPHGLDAHHRHEH
jgi:drug/metabolite transporter (DMT)-like permease